MAYPPTPLPDVELGMGDGEAECAVAPTFRI